VLAKRNYYFKLILLVAIFLCSENALSFDDKNEKIQIVSKASIYVCDLSVQPEKYYR